MNLVPIPTTDEYLNGTAPLWRPFLEGISKRSREPVESLLDLIYRKEVQPILVWDGNKAVALLGIRFCRRGLDLVGEWVWMTGKGRKDWQHLLPELERYLKDMGCVECRPICRLGWSRLLEQQGYRTTHVIMEKTL